ncbi:MAG: hypothetical protein K940chlam3_01256, partial [Chlamydiae bacterium]|nr:hypothetical protein [Chlamydiota bacterium]
MRVHPKSQIHSTQFQGRKKANPLKFLQYQVPFSKDFYIIEGPRRLGRHRFKKIEIAIA